ncbi:hypothetical protein ACOME3_003074 [Neoechinorhynchus agilis]
MSFELSDEELLSYAEEIECKRIDFSEFPFEPYASQKQLIQSLYSSIDSGELATFESPTGTGKSLCLLFASLKWLKAKLEKDRDTVKRVQESIIQWDADESDGSDDNWLEKAKRRIERQESCLNELDDIEDLVNAEDAVLERQKIFAKKLEVDAEDDGDVKQVRKIFFASRTHSQISQILTELHKMPSLSSITRVVVLASRQSFCINDQIKCLVTNGAINDACLRLIDKEKCPYKSTDRLRSLSDAMLFEQFKTKDSILHKAVRLKACAYYASRDALPSAHLVLLPYNLLLSAEMRESIGIKLDGRDWLLQSKFKGSSLTFLRHRFSGLYLLEYSTEYIDD